jgi:tetratricopeptide (TPR) repeat protein
LPFDPQTLRSAGYNEIQRIIREVDPPRPSTRLTKLGKEAEEVARRRGLELNSLTTQLKNELEWIPLKAMRKERAQRYASPTELAEDVQNYLNNRPLRAAPESAAYRARKFLRRNKAGVTAAAAMLFLLVAGIVATTWQAVRANREKQEAQHQREQAVIASDNLKEVNRFLTDDLLASAAPEVSRGKELTVREAVDRAAQNVSQRFQARPATEAAIHMMLSDTYDSLGYAERGLKHAQLARDLLVRSSGPDDPRTLTATGMFGRQLNYVGRGAEAEPILRDAMARAERAIGPNDEVTLNIVTELASSLRQQRKFAEAEPFYRRFVDGQLKKNGRDSQEYANAINNLAVFLSDTGHDDQAEPLLREALRIWRKQGDDYVYYLSTLANLARLVEDKGQLAESEAMYREILAIRKRVLKDDHPETLASMNDLANVLAVERKFDEAEAINRDALERRLRQWGPDDLGTLQSMNNLGNTLERRGNYAEAEKVLRDCVERRRRVLTPSHPHTIGSTMRLVRALVAQQKWRDAETYLNELLKPENFKSLAPAVQSEMLDVMARVCDATHRPDDAATFRARAATLPSTQPSK